MKKRIYGPVASRRLGYSLGVDCVPLKTCSYDCLYCQLGRSVQTTVVRQPYISVETIMGQLRERLEQKVRIDHITLGGSGEPTLHSDIGELIHHIKKTTTIPVAVLTNGSLLGDPAVQKALMKADVVLPSLDAHENSGFEKINRPNPAILFDEMVTGLASFGKVFPGQIWLEIFLLKGMNDSENDAYGFKTLIDQINPDKIHLNTAVRPVTENSAKKVPQATMEMFCRVIGKNAEVAVNLRTLHEKAAFDDTGMDLFSLLARRPCTLDDLALGLRSDKGTIQKEIGQLLKTGKIETIKQGKHLYYQLAAQNDG